jgi:hypothetical protein
MKLGRKDPCPCGSEKKYKRCCYPKFGTAEESAPAASGATTDSSTASQETAKPTRVGRPPAPVPTHGKSGRGAPNPAAAVRRRAV